MNYEGQICRSPMERSSFMLPTAVGCSYNRCRFCTLFKHLKYRELPMTQIESELCRVKDLGGNPKTIFLGDGNAFGQGTDRLLRIIDRIHFYFPACTSINMDATITNIRQKSDSELHDLCISGVRHLYLGIESGLDDVLSFMEKDHSLDEALAQIDRLHNAGLIYDAHIMTGIAGKGRGKENALALAAFFNRTHPSRIINFSLFLHERAPLYQNIQDRSFTPADELENLKEERALLEQLDCGPVSYDGFHDFVEYRVRGTLPKDREKMLSGLDHAIDEAEKDFHETGKPIFAFVK
ncbi:MAG: radical SAM protein [Lachnospiraceae bacterium]|nr:radical SAM protein [Lachnospiraceae bacterium]